MKGWLALSWLVCAQAFAAEPVDTWQDYQRGTLTWSARMVTDPAEGLCRHPSVDCRKILVEVRNDRSDAPIYCGASILFPQPNAYAIRERGWHNWIPVEPGKISTVNVTWVPKDLDVKDIHTECYPKAPAPLATTAIMDVTDRPPMPPPPPVAPCSTKMQSAADPDVYYPPAAKAEKREGAPIIRAIVRKGQTSPQAVVLVTSSGQPDFDEAGLQVARQSRYFTNCEEGTVTFRVKFKFVDEDAPREQP
jgi:TonB family protein